MESIEKQPIQRTPEQIEEREGKRKELREILPVDLQLEFIQNKPEKDKWQFEGKLVSRIRSKLDEDKLFKEAIKAVNSKDIGQLEKLKEESKEKREQIAENFNDYLDLKQAMQKCFDEGELHSAGKIAVALNDKESAKQAMQECFDKGWPGSAGKIAVALADKDPESAKQVMQECFDKGELYSAGNIAVALNDKESAKQAMQKCFDEGDLYSARNIAVALADKDPESAKQVMQKCFDEGRPDSAGKIAVVLDDKESAKQAMQECFDKGWPAPVGEIAVALAKNFTFNPESKRLIEAIKKSGTKDYGIKTVANLLEQNQDLGKFKKEYLPKYFFIKKLAEQTNNNIEETKKWQNPEEFFIKHNVDIVDLQSLDLNFSTQLLKNLLFRGLSFSEANIDIYKKALSDKEIFKEIQAYTKTNKNLNGYNLSDLLETASAYQTLNEKESLFKTLDAETKDFQELKTKLNKGLLENLALSLDLKTEVSEQELSKWNIKYFTNLIINREMIKAQENEDNLNVHDAVLKSVFENKFKEFISSLNQKDRIGKEIAKHNQEVEKEFKKHNINWDKWLNFKGQVIMTINTQKKQDREALFNQFEERFKEWQESITEFSLKQSLKKDLSRLSQKKKEFDPTKININDPKWIDSFFPSYAKSINYLKSKDSNFKLPQTTEESFGHLVETIKTLTQEQQKEQTNKKEFSVKLWDRDPRIDLFQGNATHCCIAVGVKETPPGGGLTTFHPETIFQYLIDKGVNVAEIVDPDTNETVAQTWLFVTLDENNKPVLVADNFEVNNRYPAGNNVNRGIRESMFEFMNKYTQECNINKIVLGNVGTNDVETEGMKVIKLPSIKKLGGYFNNDKYYLETLGKTDGWKVEHNM